MIRLTPVRNPSYFLEFNEFETGHGQKHMEKTRNKYEMMPFQYNANTSLMNNLRI